MTGIVWTGIVRGQAGGSKPEADQMETILMGTNPEGRRDMGRQGNVTSRLNLVNLADGGSPKK